MHKHVQKHPTQTKVNDLQYNSLRNLFYYMLSGNQAVDWSNELERNQMSVKEYFNSRMIC